MAVLSYMSCFRALGTCAISRQICASKQTGQSSDLEAVEVLHQLVVVLLLAALLDVALLELHGEPGQGVTPAAVGVCGGWRRSDIRHVMGGDVWGGTA